MAGWPEDVQVDPETGEDTDKEKGPTPGILGGRRQELNKAPEALADVREPSAALRERDSPFLRGGGTAARRGLTVVFPPEAARAGRAGLALVGAPREDPAWLETTRLDTATMRTTLTPATYGDWDLS